MTFTSPLPNGPYRAVLTTAVTDAAGNPLARPVVWDFESGDFIVWINPAGGNWNAATNWSSGQAPGPGDHVFFRSAGALTITLPTGVTTVRQLTAHSPVRLTRGTLDVTDSIRFHSSFILDNITIRSAHIRPSEGAILSSTSSIQNILDGATVEGDVDLASARDYLRLRNGAKLNA